MRGNYKTNTHQQKELIQNVKCDEIVRHMLIPFIVHINKQIRISAGLVRFIKYHLMTAEENTEKRLFTL